MTRATASRQPAGGLRPEPAAQSQPIGAHRAHVNGLGVGKSDEWYTPPQIFDALCCDFDLDVAAPIGGPPTVPAAYYYSKLDDALTKAWWGFVWMNAPFGGRNALAPWLDKFFAHGDGVALTPDRTSAPWFHEAWKRADAVMFCRKTPFLLPNGNKAGSPAFGTALWAAGPRGVAALETAHAKGFGLIAHLRATSERDVP